MFVLDIFGAFWGVFGAFFGILEYIRLMFAKVCLRLLFGMGIMFVFVFVLFWCHLGSFVNVNVRPNVNINVNVNVHPNLDVWTKKLSSTFDNKDTSNVGM